MITSFASRSSGRGPKRTSRRSPATARGHFTIAVQISADAPSGGYAISATRPDGSSLRAAMVIAGAPVSDGEGAPPEQDEGLPNLAASPAAAQASPGRIAAVESLPPKALASLAAAATSTATATAPSAGATSDGDPVPFVALAGAVGALGVLLWRTRRPRTPAESADLS